MQGVNTSGCVEAERSMCDGDGDGDVSCPAAVEMASARRQSPVRQTCTPSTRYLRRQQHSPHAPPPPNPPSSRISHPIPTTVDHTPSSPSLRRIHLPPTSDDLVTKLPQHSSWSSTQPNLGAPALPVLALSSYNTLTLSRVVRSR